MKKINILTLILSTGIVACGYVHIYYSHKLSKLDGLDQLAIALSIYFLIQLWFSGNYLFKGLTFILLAGSTLLLLNILHNNYADNQLKRYGTKANATVTSIKYMSGHKSYPGIIINFTYTSRGRIYNHSIMDDVEADRRFSVGDTIPIKYSSMDPDLFEELGN
ncbi:DUF3592 domain-containing protein [Pedobacter panaciterrae]|uniref:DUF3592 domain-containing protein n=1 Tax=Pedobacter panaciterrae TaxID=363849 RepID=UPI0025941E81|nr:DUF3592 domain-containing protein [uncultured Pedobacter sp.]